MHMDKIEIAKRIATEFITAVKAYQEDAKTNRYIEITGNKISANLRRKSMDLTRALADLRNR